MPDPAGDVVERLRRNLTTPDGSYFLPVCEEAAAEIERLQAEVAEAQERAARNWTLAAGLQRESDDLRARVAELKADAGMAYVVMLARPEVWALLSPEEQGIFKRLCDTLNVDWFTKPATPTPDPRDTRIAELEAGRGELQHTFDLQWQADMRAVAAWRAANPGNDLVLPDRTDHVLWLFGRVQELEAERDSYRTPDDMREFWRKAIGGSYQPVKWGKYRAGNAASVKEVLDRLKAGEPCPEAADVIAALVHAQCVAWNIASDLGDQMRKSNGDEPEPTPSVPPAVAQP